jgi:hypothetical protein
VTSVHIDALPSAMSTARLKLVPACEQFTHELREYTIQPVVSIGRNWSIFADSQDIPARRSIAMPGLMPWLTQRTGNWPAFARLAHWTS